MLVKNHQFTLFKNPGGYNEHDRTVWIINPVFNDTELIRCDTYSNIKQSLTVYKVAHNYRQGHFFLISLVKQVEQIQVVMYFKFCMFSNGILSL